jgi:hypothetical protein
VIYRRIHKASQDAAQNDIDSQNYAVPDTNPAVNSVFIIGRRSGARPEARTEEAKLREDMHDIQI